MLYIESNFKILYMFLTKMTNNVLCLEDSDGDIGSLEQVY